MQSLCSHEVLGPRASPRQAPPPPSWPSLPRQSAPPRPWREANQQQSSRLWFDCAMHGASGHHSWQPRPQSSFWPQLRPRPRRHLLCATCSTFPTLACCRGLLRDFLAPSHQASGQGFGHAGSLQLEQPALYHPGMNESKAETTALAHCSSPPKEHSKNRDQPNQLDLLLHDLCWP